MALGMGQNWKRVQMVVHMGRSDPANIAQMIGQCGRNGRPGLAVLLVEKTWRNGKNLVKQLVSGPEQTDEDRMDALAITPVCLRVAFSLDNLYVHSSPLFEKYSLHMDSVLIGTCWN
jgi:superfamily II DNA helicase RecQ